MTVCHASLFLYKKISAAPNKRHDGAVITLINKSSYIWIDLRVLLLILSPAASLLSGTLFGDCLFTLADINSLCDHADHLILKVVEILLMQNSENYK